MAVAKAAAIDPAVPAGVARMRFCQRADDRTIATGRGYRRTFRVGDIGLRS